MPESYYRTGQAAAELGISSPALRKLCQHGLIEAEYTGKQWRVSVAEVQRLKKEGVPPVPTTIEAGGAGPSKTNSGRSAAALLAPPSSAATASAESALIAENELKAKTAKVASLELSKKATEVHDFYRDRRRREDERAAAERQHREDSELQQREAEATQKAADRRRQWEAKWINYAISEKPWGAPDDLNLDIHREAVAALAVLDPDESKFTVQNVIDAAVARAVKPWREIKEKEKALDEAIDQLPLSVRWYPPWKERARQIGSDAIGRARTGATVSEMTALAKVALLPLVAECEHREKIDRAMSIVAVPGANRDEQQDAQDAVRSALEGLDLGVSDRQIEQAKNTALATIRERVASRQKLEEEQRREREDEANRIAVVSAAAWKLPHGIPETAKKTALVEVAEAIADLPAGSSRSDMEKARDEIINRCRAKQNLIDAGLREIYSYAGKLLQKYEFDAGETAWRIERRVKPEVEKTLQDELDGTEGQQFVTDRVRELVKELA